MVFKSIIGTTCICLTAISLNVSAALVNADWKNAGDNLITRDTASGLEWLDLTQTVDLSYDSVTGLLGTGAMFSGFRYASNAEVVQLFQSFNLDIGDYYNPFTSIHALDPRVDKVIDMLGDTLAQFDQSGYSSTVRMSIGLTAETRSTNIYGEENKYVIGIYEETNFPSYITEPYYNIYGHYSTLRTFESDPISGSYLVRSSSGSGGGGSVVPVPAAAWLFASGLLGLIGVARRKKA